MRSYRVEDSKKYLRPEASMWSQVVHEDIALMPTPLAMQPTEYIRKSWEGRDYGQTKSLSVASVHDGHNWAIRVSWPGVSVEGKDFPDAIAVALPISGKPALILMGAPDAPIHILRWQANKEGAHSIVATGIGQSRPGPGGIQIGAQAEAKDGVRSVVITRALGHGKDIAPLAVGKKTGVGFALWMGGNDERAGIKAFSLDWTELVLDAKESS
jgi:DMSO reductase family type II enzyme heme b subunit